MSEWVRPGDCSANECIEVRFWPRAVEIRSANFGDVLTGTVFASPAEWARFVAAIKNGEFDDPVV